MYTASFHGGLNQITSLFLFLLLVVEGLSKYDNSSVYPAFCNAALRIGASATKCHSLLDRKDILLLIIPGSFFFLTDPLHGGLNPHNSDTAGYLYREWSIVYFQIWHISLVSWVYSRSIIINKLCTVLLQYEISCLKNAARYSY